jgi:hypothetical protein
MKIPAISIAALVLSLTDGAPLLAAGFQVLTVGKVARFVNRGDPASNGAVIVVGRDRALATLLDPRCPTASTVALEAYLQSTVRDVVLASVSLDCAKWAARGRGYVYADPTGTVRAIRYTPSGLRIEVKGPGFTPIGGPVGFVQAQLGIGTDLLRARFHNFRRNDASEVLSRKPSHAAAAGEAGFWDVLSGDDDSEATETATIARLEQAARRDPRDGRSRFLLAMMHFYRFGQQVTSYAAVSEAAKAELHGANAAFATAVPLLWNDATATGDSRVPGFAAAAEYLQGLVDGDATLRDQGLADLDQSIAQNAFFNVFDLIPVLQATTPGDPVFQAAFAKVDAYLNDPETLACVVTQPEICANAGFVPHNVQGALTLFGDIYVKHGDLTPANNWYTLAAAFPAWPFTPVLDDHRTNALARAALYQDADPSNDPLLIGAGTETCAFCHRR